ncbi:hypothetical protein HJ030_23805 [Vibrio parahaemolyticus]|nr:hypothetical protein [Vibrio parahaemolyticus]HCE1970464.1 hypothetical protein [Vibrio parahaemolyticus]
MQEDTHLQSSNEVTGHVSVTGTVKLDPSLTEVIVARENETSEIVLEIPTIPDLSLSTDWVAVCSFIITALIVIISNRQTVKQSTELVSSQEKLSRETASENITLTKSELTAVNRQQWINTLREDLAQFISSTNAIWDLHRMKEGRKEVLASLQDPQFVMRELYDWSCTYNTSIKEAEGLSAKIKLLINPKEPNSIKLASLLDRSMKTVKANKSPSNINNQIISLSQVILKLEWERVKDLK